MIVVFGSLNMDLVFPVGQLPRPGETRLGAGYQRSIGGKGGNQAAAAALAGAEVRMVGCIGEDEFGAEILAQLASVDIDVNAIRRVGSATGCAAVAVDASGANQIVVASGANLEASAGQVADDWLGPNTLLMLQCEVPLQQNWTLAARARANGARIVLNAAPASPIPAEAGGLLDTLIVNQHEAADLAAGLGYGPQPAQELASRLAAHFRTACIVTLGVDGAVAADPQGLYRIGALQIDAIDTTAAGDAFVGTFAAALDRGLDRAAALHRASIAGGLACSKMGAFVSLPRANEIDGALDRLAAPARIAC